MNNHTQDQVPGGRARGGAHAGVKVESPEHAIRRRDHRIRELSDALDREMRVSATLRDELARLGSRVADLERAWQTAMPASDAGHYAEGAPTAAAPGGRAVMETGVGSNAVAVHDTDDGMLPGGRRVATLDELMGRSRQGPDARSDSAAGDPVLYDESRFVETVPDVPYELLSPDLMLESPAPLKHARSAFAGARGALVSIDDEPPVTFPITKDIVTLGRSHLSDICIDSQLISRLHARIRRDEAQFWIEDLGSKNGIMVNSRRVERCELADGDLVNLGRVRFRFACP